MRDVAGMLEWEDLRGMVLVGHRSSAMVVTGVAERMPARFGYLVYLDTVVTRDGQSWADLPGPSVSDRLPPRARARGDGRRVRVFPTISAGLPNPCGASRSPSASPTRRRKLCRAAISAAPTSPTAGFSACSPR